MYCLITRSPIVCGFFPFAIANVTRQDASKPNVSSETNPYIGRVFTAQSWAQEVCKDMWLSCTCVRWSKASLQNCRLYRIIIRHFGEKDTLRFLNIVCYDEADRKSTHDSRKVFYFDTITDNVEACTFNSWRTRSLKRTQNTVRYPVYIMLWKEGERWC